MTMTEFSQQANRRQSFAPSALLTTIQQSGDVLAFDDIQREQSGFASKFDVWLTQLNQQVLENRHKFQKELAEYKDKVQTSKNAIENIEQDYQMEVKKFEIYQQELDIWQNTIRKLKHDKVELIEKEARSAHDLKQIEKELQQARLAKKKRLEQRAERDKRMIPEVECFKEKLALRIEAVKEGEMKFTFTCVNESDPDQEFYFCINVSNKDYELSAISPDISQSVQVLLDSLNETRDFYTFVKKTRAAFVKSVTPL